MPELCLTRLRFWYKIVLKAITMNSKTKLINILRAKHIGLFDLNDLQQILEINNRETLYKLVQRLCKAEIIERLSSGKYYFRYSEKKPADYSIANFLVQPSYISLESALSYYSLIDQFPYAITSVTPKQTRKKKVRNKTFVYSQISSKLYWGYVKENNFLIATPEKTLFDLIYFVHKTKRRLPSEINTNILDKERLKDYLSRVESKLYKKSLSKLGIV